MERVQLPYGLLINFMRESIIDWVLVVLIIFDIILRIIFSFHDIFIYIYTKRCETFFYKNYHLYEFASILLKTVVGIYHYLISEGKIFKP